MTSRTPTLIALSIGHSIHIADPFWTPNLWPLCQPSRSHGDYYVPPSLHCTESDAPEATCGTCIVQWRIIIESEFVPPVASDVGSVESTTDNFTYVACFPYDSCGNGPSVYECQQCFALVQEWSRDLHLKAVHPDKAVGKQGADDA